MPGGKVITSLLRLCGNSRSKRDAASLIGCSDDIMTSPPVLKNLHYVNVNIKRDYIAHNDIHL